MVQEDITDVALVCFAMETFATFSLPCWDHMIPRLHTRHTLSNTLNNPAKKKNNPKKEHTQNLSTLLHE
jgi:hypothetical protein